MFKVIHVSESKAPANKIRKEFVLQDDGLRPEYIVVGSVDMDPSRIVYGETAQAFTQPMAIKIAETMNQTELLALHEFDRQLDKVRQKTIDMLLAIVSEAKRKGPEFAVEQVRLSLLDQGVVAEDHE